MHCIEDTVDYLKYLEVGLRTGVLVERAVLPLGNRKSLVGGQLDCLCFLTLSSHSFIEEPIIKEEQK